MKRTSLLSLPLLLWFASSGCSDTGSHVEDECDPGQLACECLENFSCDLGLMCQNGTCVTQSNATGGSSGTGGNSTGGNGTGGGGTGGDTATGGAQTGGNGTGGENSSTGGNASIGFSISSSELSEGGMFLDKHTCQLAGFDKDESPPLAWSGAPEGTMSFAITFIDSTLVNEGNTLGYHWAIWDLAASVNELPAKLPDGMTLTTPVSAKQSRTSYLGPCPNFGASGSETHTYEFTIYALPTATADLSGMIDATMIATLKAAALDSVTLSGQSSASSQF